MIALRPLAVLLALVALGSAARAGELTPAEKTEAQAIQSRCRPDALRLCLGVRPGEGRGLACLEAQADGLSAECRASLPRARALFEKKRA